MFKNKKGITLIALILTIIILIIIATIIIASISDEDKRIVEISQDAKEDLETKQEEEILKAILVEIEYKSFLNTNAKIEYLIDALTLEGINNFEVFSNYINIKDRTHIYTDLMPEFSGL